MEHGEISLSGSGRQLLGDEALAKPIWGCDMLQCASVPIPSLRERLSRREIVLAAGVYDGLTASLAADAGFAALYVSGASIAYTRLDLRTSVS